MSLGTKTQVEWGIDLATEHERFLAEETFKHPVIVYNYPKVIHVKGWTTIFANSQRLRYRVFAFICYHRGAVQSVGLS